jgi:ATP-dependent Clp protease ATP-binding subunit ClpC
MSKSEPKQLSKRAQRVLLLANRESKRLGCPHVASEHLLLGALAYRSPAVSGALKRAGLEIRTLRAYVGRVGSAPEDAPHGYGPSMHEALRRSCEHSGTLSHREIEPEHLLLGVLGETHGGAARALRHFGVDARAAKRDIIQRMG